MKKMSSLLLIPALCAMLVSSSGCSGGSKGGNSPASSTSKQMLTFGFASPASTGVIDEAAQTVSVTVPYNTDVTALKAVFTTSGIKTTIKGVEQESGVTPNNFANVVIYRVTAEDESYSEYTVTVTVATSDSKDITGFTITGQYSSTITGTDITITVPLGTDKTSLAPSITHTGASISPASGVVKNFTNAVTYTVTAVDGSTKAYKVTVNAVGYTTKEITYFNFFDFIARVEINGTDIDVTVPFGTDVTNIAPTIKHTGIRISPASGEAKDFTDQVIYTVTAADGNSKEYTVTVTVTDLPLVNTGGGFSNTYKGTSATITGFLFSEGSSELTESGICWNTTGSPTLSDPHAVTGGYTPIDDEITSFTAEMTGLAECTTYYARAYATNSSGTSYGGEIIFNSGYIVDGSTVRCGGYVFYNDGSGKGYACSTDDLDYNGEYVMMWSYYNTDENGDNNTVAPELYNLGDGIKNTEYIYNTHGPAGDNTLSNYRAFYVCINYSSGGYDDWFLPSSSELIKLHLNLGIGNLGNLKDTCYWSSTEDRSEPYRATSIDFSSNTISYVYAPKNYDYRVRAIRAF